MTQIMIVQLQYNMAIVQIQIVQMTIRPSTLINIDVTVIFIYNYLDLRRKSL